MDKLFLQTQITVLKNRKRNGIHKTKLQGLCYSGFLFMFCLFLRKGCLLLSLVNLKEKEISVNLVHDSYLRKNGCARQNYPKSYYL
jgi:hypothetical protein